MINSEPIICLSLLDKSEESDWISAFNEIKLELKFVSKSFNENTSLPLFAIAHIEEARKLINKVGCIHSPPLVVVLPKHPASDDFEYLRQAGVALILTGYPNKYFAEQIYNLFGQSNNWFKGVGRWGHLPDVLQFVSADHRAALVTVCGPRASNLSEEVWTNQRPPNEAPTSAWFGRIYIDQGAVIYSETPQGLSGDEAVAALLKINNAVVRVLEVFLPSPEGLNPSSSIQSCLLNAHYIIDESMRTNNDDDMSEIISIEPEFDFSDISISENSSIKKISSMHNVENFNINDIDQGLEAKSIKSKESIKLIDITSDQFNYIVSKLGIPRVLRSDTEGGILNIEGQFDDADLTAAVAATSQQIADQLATWFGGLGATSWSLSIGQSCIYGAATSVGDLLVAIDQVSKTPAMTQKRVENEIQSLERIYTS